MSSYLIVLALILDLTIADETVTEEITELKVETIEKSSDCSRQAAKGDMLSMHYKGSLLNGKEFDSSHGRGEPFKFQLGIGQVIKGWDQGLIGICPGEKRKLHIPSDLAYGDVGAGDLIPPKSSLVFEVECVSIEDGPPLINIFKEIDSDKDNQLSRDELSEYLKKQVPEGTSADMPDQDKLVEDIFLHEDKDKDGFISHDEFSGPKHDEL
ncbi:hypothetical protein NH340_JMT00566 [Sarcoptes scabiei]|nr:hypothetical protein NH340_JMT00566 [Sarcoptes scabiei]